MEIPVEEKLVVDGEDGGAPEGAEDADGGGGGGEGVEG